MKSDTNVNKLYLGNDDESVKVVFSFSTPNYLPNNILYSCIRTLYRPVYAWSSIVNVQQTDGVKVKTL
jgi:hypothetical protein